MRKALEACELVHVSVHMSVHGAASLIPRRHHHSSHGSTAGFGMATAGDCWSRAVDSQAASKPCGSTRNQPTGATGGTQLHPPHGPSLYRLRFGFASILLSSGLRKVSGELGWFWAAASKIHVGCVEAGRGARVQLPPHTAAAESREPGWLAARSHGVLPASCGLCQCHPQRAGRGRCHINKYSMC